MEKRISMIPTQFRAGTEEGQKIIEGKFIVFNERTELYPGTYEEIAPEAVNDISDVRALYNHNHDIVLGSTLSRTLILDKRDDGLYGKIIINPDDSDALNAHARIQRGDIQGCSFGFIPVDEEYDEKEKVIRVKRLDLFEVSPCVFPAYPQTEVAARSRNEIEKRFNKERAKRLLKKIRGIK